MEERELLLRHIRDLARRTFTGDYETSTGFLSLAEQAAFFAAQKKDSPSKKNIFEGVPFILTGGYPEAERRILVFLPSYLDETAFAGQEKTDASLLVPIEVRPRSLRFCEELTHRDFLGALMNLGVSRDRIGDILVDLSGESSGNETSSSRREEGEGEGAVIFVLREIAGLIADELDRVKHTSVDCRINLSASARIRPVFEERTGSVASERLDALLSLAFRLSRDKAKELIQRELCFIDGAPALSPGQTLRPGSRISARGFGKFIYDGTDATSRKGRLIVRIRLYR